MRKILQLTLALMLAATGGLMAQVTSASIVGKVVDKNNEGLPGASVIAVHGPSGTQYGTITRTDGRYSLPNVRVGGPYKITVSFVGYSTQEKTDLFISLGNEADITFPLAESGTELGEVVVSGVVDPILSADRTGAATNVTRAQLTQLPTLSRSFADFTRLTPQSNGLSFGGRSSSFNNITIDGALFNNSFGLSSTVGGQTSAQPISLDSFEEIQVNIAPFDVRQGSFTGASINAVTRSGTNEISGSVYTYFRNENTIGYKVGTVEVPKNDFSNKQTGFRIGGPIIKNKLFFFLNGEIERGERPSSSFSALRPGLTADGTTVSRAQAAQLDALSTLLATRYGYVTGPYENFPLENTSDKFTVKLDYNINDNHRVNIKYNYLKSYADITPSASGVGLTGGRNPSASGMPFYAAYYGINNNLNSVIAELNSTFGVKFSNTLNVGYSAFRDFRSSPGGVFPLVDIGDGTGTVNGSQGTTTSAYFTSFGYEPFTAFNLLNTDLIQATDNFTAYMGSHTITAGASIESYKFKNGFAQQYYGQYRYNSLQDFLNDIDPATTNLPGASAVNFLQRYSALPGGAFPYANLDAQQISVYAQDQWSLLGDKLKLTYGLRADVPIYGNPDAVKNPTVEALTFRDGETIDVSVLPKSQVLWSPRVGFNYDVFGNRKTTIRGGTGIFTGRVPFVWLSNQLSNNGVIFGTLNVNQVGTVNTSSYPFNPDVTAYIPSTATLPTQYALNSSVPDYKIAQIYRSNLGVDQVLPGGIILTLEAMFSKELNNAYLRDVNLKNPTGTLSDGRPYFGTIGATGSYVSLSNRVNPSLGTAGQALVQTNTSNGYSYTLTAQIRKRMKNLDATLAYNYGKAKDVNSGGSTAGGIFSGRPIVDDPNGTAASLSDFNLTHRLIGSVNYSVDYAKHFRTTIGAFLTAQSGFHYSYTYSSDVNNDGATNDLIFIPKTQADIKLAPNPTSGGVVDPRTAAQIWSQLDAFISQDPYLSKHRGAFAERNGARTPGNMKIDARILQDFYVNVKGKRNTIQLSLDIFNLTNLIDSNWGITKAINNSRNQLLGLSSVSTAGEPTFTFTQQNAATLTPLANSFANNTGLTSRWQMQFGVRYIFN